MHACWLAHVKQHILMHVLCMYIDLRCARKRLAPLPEDWPGLGLEVGGRARLLCQIGRATARAAWNPEVAMHARSVAAVAPVLLHV